MSKSIILTLGDAIDEMTKIPDSSINLILTDPPYSLPNNQFRPQARIKQKSFGDFSTYGHFFKDFLAQAQRVLTPTGHLVLFCDETFYPVLYPHIYESFYNSKLIVWDKGKIGMGGIWRRQFELIIDCMRTPQLEKSGDSDIIRVAPVVSNLRLHNSEKPVVLLKQIITKLTKVGDTVLDPFLGSGSTGEACKTIDRNFIGIEISSEYFAKASFRLSDDTIKQPSPAKSGKG